MISIAYFIKIKLVVWCSNVDTWQASVPHNGLTSWTLQKQQGSHSKIEGNFTVTQKSYSGQHTFNGKALISEEVKLSPPRA